MPKKITTRDGAIGSLEACKMLLVFVDDVPARAFIRATIDEVVLYIRAKSNDTATLPET